MTEGACREDRFHPASPPPPRSGTSPKGEDLERSARILNHPLLPREGGGLRRLDRTARRRPEVPAYAGKHYASDLTQAALVILNRL